MKQDEFITRTHDEFSYTSKLEVNGFPTVFLEKGGQMIPLARGYVNLQTLEKQYLKAIK